MPGNIIVSADRICHPVPETNFERKIFCVGIVFEHVLLDGGRFFKVVLAEFLKFFVHFCHGHDAVETPVVDEDDEMLGLNLDGRFVYFCGDFFDEVSAVEGVRAFLYIVAAGF